MQEELLKQLKKTEQKVKNKFNSAAGDNFFKIVLVYVLDGFFALFFCSMFSESQFLAVLFDTSYTLFWVFWVFSIGNDHQFDQIWGGEFLFGFGRQALMITNVSKMYRGIWNDVYKVSTPYTSLRVQFN